MQTIDLGTISIGGEDAAAESSGGTPAAEEYLREDTAAEALFPSQPAPVSDSCETCGDRRREEPRDEHRKERAKHCPEGDEVYFEKCEDYKLCQLGDAPIDGQGRILDLCLRLKSVCPGKRVAVGVMLYEMDAHGHEFARGMKTFTVAAHRQSRCTDISVETVRFILPEDIGTGTSGDSCGCRRHFLVKVAAHYIDFNSAGAAL